MKYLPPEEVTHTFSCDSSSNDNWFIWFVWTCRQIPLVTIYTEVWHKRAHLAACKASEVCHYQLKSTFSTTQVKMKGFCMFVFLTAGSLILVVQPAKANVVCYNSVGIASSCFMHEVTASIQYATTVYILYPVTLCLKSLPVLLHLCIQVILVPLHICYSCRL